MVTALAVFLKAVQTVSALTLQTITEHSGSLKRCLFSAAVSQDDILDSQRHPTTELFMDSAGTCQMQALYSFFLSLNSFFHFLEQTLYLV